MSELTTRYKPSDTELTAVHAKLELLREIDRVGGYNLKRDQQEYEKVLRGLDAFFDYVRGLETSNIVLDIGTGHKIAIDQIAGSEYGQGLRFIATGLTALPEGTHNQELVPYIVTDGETLSGVDTNTIGGILAVYSITHTESPEMTVDAIDRVLVPGGVVKTALYRSFDGRHIKNLHVHTYESFVGRFRARGYDVAVHPTQDVLLAIKQQTSRLPVIDAKTLLNADQFPRATPVSRR